MFSPSLKNNFLAVLFAGLLAVTLPAAAEYVSDQEAVEAETITVDPLSGAVIITGCERCPLELVADSNTQFFSQKRKISGDEISAHSGKAGTAIFITNTLQAIKIRW